MNTQGIRKISGQANILRTKRAIMQTIVIPCATTNMRASGNSYRADQTVTKRNRHSMKMIANLPLDHRRVPLIGRAYPSVVPITDEISLNERGQFFHCHSFCIMSTIEDFFFHPFPHALASGIVMAASVCIMILLIKKEVFFQRHKLFYTITSYVLIHQFFGRKG